MILNILLIMVGHIQHSKISEKLSQGGLYCRWLTFWYITSQNGQAHFKKLAANVVRCLKCV